jgi:hypothetical protein
VSSHNNELLNVHQVPQPDIDDPSAIQAEDGERAVVKTVEEVSTKVTETICGVTASTNQSTKIKMNKRNQKQRQAMMTIELQHCDIIKDGFWVQRRWILEEER